MWDHSLNFNWTDVDTCVANTQEAIRNLNAAYGDVRSRTHTLPRGSPLVNKLKLTLTSPQSDPGFSQVGLQALRSVRCRLLWPSFRFQSAPLIGLCRVQTRAQQQNARVPLKAKISEFILKRDGTLAELTSHELELGGPTEHGTAAFPSSHSLHSLASQPDESDSDSSASEESLSVFTTATGAGTTTDPLEHAVENGTEASVLVRFLNLDSHALDCTHRRNTLVECKAALSAALRHPWYGPGAIYTSKSGEPVRETCMRVPMVWCSSRANPVTLWSVAVWKAGT